MAAFKFLGAYAVQFVFHLNEESQKLGEESPLFETAHTQFALVAQTQFSDKRRITTLIFGFQISQKRPAFRDHGQKPAA